MLDPEDDPDEAPTASAFLSVLIHDHGAPEGWRADVEGLVGGIQIDHMPAHLPDHEPGCEHEGEEMQATVEIRLAIHDSDRVVHLMIDADAAIELAERIATHAHLAREE